MVTRAMGTRVACSLGGAHVRGMYRPLHICAPAAVRPSRATTRPKAAAAEAPPRDDVITADPDNNITDNIYGKIGVNLHLRRNHPLSIIRDRIYQYFDAEHNGAFKKYDDLYPVVTTHANFDSVLVPVDHVSRSPNDTYYVDKQTVLRCDSLVPAHSSAYTCCALCLFKRRRLWIGACEPSGVRCIWH